MSLYKQKAIARLSSEYCCRKDLGLTFVSDTSELTALLGYSAEEIRTVYHNSLLEIVDKGSRENIYQKVMKQLAERDSVELLFPVRHKNGNIIWLLDRACKTTAENNEEILCGILVDITGMKHKYDAEKEKTRMLQELVQKDSLTQIYNAQATRKQAEKYLSEQVGQCALLIIDLDDFKRINDSYGHLFGNEVLVQVARTIQRLFRYQDIVGRIGGEEFLVLMKNISDTEIVNMRCRQLNSAFREIYADRLAEQNISCSIGAAFSPIHGTTYTELFRNADRALYRAKYLGKDQYVFYEDTCLTGYEETEDESG